MIEVKSSREVVKCTNCALVQFRTQSGFCRRCDRSLSVKIPIPSLESQPKPRNNLYQNNSAIRDELIRVRTNIRNIRETEGFTQEDVGRVIGMPRSNIARIECGLLVSSTLTTLQRFAVGLQVDLPYLFVEKLPKDLKQRLPLRLSLNIPMALEQLIKERNYSLRRLGKRSDIHHHMISGWLHGYQEPTTINIAKLSISGFEMTVYDFVVRVVAVSQEATIA